MKPLIGITMGDPAGVGPELCLSILREPRVLKICVPVIFGDSSVLKKVARKCRLPGPVAVLSLKDWKENCGVSKATVVDCGIIGDRQVMPGRISALCGRASYGYIEEAVRSALANRISGIATAPINKAALRLAGIRGPGHTEILARLTKTKRFCMMMACDELAVSLVTIHVPHRMVSGLLTRNAVKDVIRLTNDAMKKTGKRSPRIVVCGLNPHAGEGGLFGGEEGKIIIPSVRAARRRGMHVIGPLPPDTAFLPGRMKQTDAYVVMYHDQGLIPFKMLAFDKGVNITLGLPIVRTSVDHGTAFDIAWKGKVSPESMVQAVLWAVKLARRA